ncbi:DUF3732 domain-containing protein [Acinetobacter gerneri]|uniref:DUF3732 domain-containing protein n=1 Tax=Acinetobacter gerneri TaxID=202952 RepID=UPI0032160B94
MKFGFDEIILWSNHNQVRKIYFKRNKVNLITGKSGMGKTSIMKIIDYCLLSSKHQIPHSIINENVSWYGIKIYINNNQYLIARKSPSDEHVSQDYYFSNTNFIPEVPEKNIDSNETKKILNNEFSVTDNTILSYGGNFLQAGSKISFRYFMLFNTISEDIITNTNQFFDKQNEDRYREALPRIFDLALTIDNVDNILNKELKDSLQKRITKELQKGEIITNKSSFFDAEKLDILNESQRLGIAINNNSNLENIDFTKLFSEEKTKDYSSFSKDIMELYSIKIKIKRLNRLKSEYYSYKETLAKNLDSLLPIDLIHSNDTIIRGNEFSSIIKTLTYELNNIKSIISIKQPLEIETLELLDKLKNDEKKLQHEIDNYPNEIKTLKNFNEFITSIGKINAKNELFNSVNITETYNHELINELQDQLNSIDILNIEKEKEKELVLSLINEIGNDILKYIHKSLENYGSWNFYFNYQEKATQLRKPQSSITENVGSSSNHMFLHLLHFLSLHYVAIIRKSPYVPSFLIIDQLSRPYYGTDNENLNQKYFIEKNSDKDKVYSALGLLDMFINVINKRHSHEFQMILIEHIPKTYSAQYDNFHIVENFDSENPLIPFDWY